MPKSHRLKCTQSVPLPPGWEMAQEPDTNKVYFVDHNNKRTQWIDPRDRSA